ncbi:hypothetical protein J2Z22_001836 [Paenibacillus forsythiae]|uniref:DUF1836 domain-containing protein n=1 Tax=Paenibacillus forsythiae TaxID=365616 RepID=A0ABU3H659_9BACL|nr:DUF1836 domain-containing protein [Paenibacillus forsythiae]MDT3426310.1 hypothetical protein [Paenibacillus forsythiae]
MESFTLTRAEMSSLLLSLTGTSGQTPLHILQEAWAKLHQREMREGSSLNAFLSTQIPPILQKIIKGGKAKGLSLQEIAALGALIEYSTISITAMQNWVKRDFKEYLGSPLEGKKYSINQAAMLFMIDDLKSSLDFRSINRLFRMLFLRPERDDDDLLEPVQLYGAYTLMFEQNRVNEEHRQDRLTGRERLAQAAETAVKRLAHLNCPQRETVQNSLLVAAVSVQACYFQALARQYFNASLFLDF